MKMQSLGYYLGMSKQAEVLLLTMVGICCTIFDASLLDLNSNLRKVWEVALDPRRVSGNTQIYLKYLLSGIILVRTFSVHLYLAFYIVMLWPAIFEERPALLLPWLIVGAVKCLAMGFMSFCTGMYTCFAYGIYKPACLDFLIAQVVDHTPSFYMWFCVLSYYRELKICVSLIPCEETNDDFMSELTMRRRKVRYMADNMKHHCAIDEDRHLISVSTIENIVQQLTTDLHAKTTRSLDSLLGVMVAEAEKEDLMNTCDESPSDETGLNIQEKTAKLLKLTEADIIQARKNKRLAQEDILTNSMMSVPHNLAEIIPTVLKNIDRKIAARVDNLRLTKSEKGDTKSTDSSKYCMATDFMSDISEIEIGGVLNYSSHSLLPKNEDLSEKSLPVSEKLKAVSEEDLEPPSENQVEIPQSQEVAGEKPVEQQLKQQSNISKWEKSTYSKTSDFGCQASTLSRSVLKSPPAGLKRYVNTTVTSKKTAPRTPLTKPPGRVTGNEITEIMPAKVETPNTCLFKTDGYTMAYNEKMKHKTDTNSTKRSSKRIKQ